MILSVAQVRVHSVLDLALAADMARLVLEPWLLAFFNLDLKTSLSFSLVFS